MEIIYRAKKECNMPRLRNWMFSAFIFTFLFLCTSSAEIDDTMVLIAGQASLVKAQAWIDFLKKNEITVDHYVLSELDKVKSQKYITIMGGMEEAGVKDLLTGVLGAAETASLAEKGNKKMFLKEDVWAPGQKVLIFAGSDVSAAAAARTESRDKWMEYLREWFDLEEVPGGLRAY
jgi:hypothetical protein